jgi:hypothetical protein
MQAQDRVDGISPATVEETVTHLQAKTVSRKPAAMVGIALVLVTGVALFQGFGFITAQLAPSTLHLPVEIHITDTGIVPDMAEVFPGQEVVFYNDQADLPHILESNSIKDQNNKPLYTPAIFPGTSQSVKISATQPAGVFQYVSTTANDVKGSLLIKADTTTPPANSSSLSSVVSSVVVSSSASSAAVSSVSSPTSSATTSSTASSSSNTTLVFAGQSSVSSTTSSQSALIPTNPYTIGSNRQHGFDADGNPITSPTTTKPTSNTGKKTQQMLHSSAPTPPRQPASGPEVWVVAALSVLSLWMLTRKTVSANVL